MVEADRISIKRVISLTVICFTNIRLFAALGFDHQNSRRALRMGHMLGADTGVEDVADFK